MKFYLTVFCLMNLITVVKSSQINIKPTTHFKAGEPTLTVRCQPSKFESSVSLDRLEVSRQREGVKTEQRLGNIKTGKQAELGPGLTSPKYTVTGSLTSNISTSFLQIVIKDPNSKDTGTYFCNAIGSGGSYIGSDLSYVQVSGGEGVIYSGSVMFLLSVAFINFILYYL